MKNSAEGLAQGTLPRYHAPMDETWSEIPGVPDLHGYEISTIGRVRKWTTKNGKAGPRIYRGTVDKGTVVYRLAGEFYPIDELMRMAFGDDADEMEARYSPTDRDRTLTQYEKEEIKLAEGWKPAYEVAEDFRIDATRVRRVWDGVE